MIGEFRAQMASIAEMFPFDDVIMTEIAAQETWHMQLEASNPVLSQPD